MTSYRLVPISSRPGACFAIDEADYERYVENMPKWIPGGSTNKYLQTDWKGSPIGRVRPRLHRMLLLGLQGDPDLVVDHINGDTLDNRRCNLRLLTQAQNVAHRANHNKNNTSGVRGLYWCDTNKRWIASIGHNNQNWWKKSFTDREEAERELTEKREEYNVLHGISPITNPPERIPELQESHEVLEQWVKDHPGSTSNKATQSARDAYDDRRRAATAAKRQAERERLLAGEQTPEVVRRLKRLDADDKRAESRRVKKSDRLL
jgi:hypothetical protein